MAIKRKIGYLSCLVVLLSAGYAHSQEPPLETVPKTEAKIKANTNTLVKNIATVDKSTKIKAPQLDNLACPEIIGISPFLALTGKAKLGEQYQNVRIGCLNLTDSNTLLDDSNLLGLDQAAQYIMNSPKFIRVYIDLEDAEVKEQGLLKRFRTKAFAVRKHLTEKGVYNHLKGNREGVFPSRFAKKEDKVKKVDKAEKKARVIAKKKPKPRDPSLDYTFQVEREKTFISQGSLGIYGNNNEKKGFQFIPMQSIYFVNDQDKLTNRAQSTLLAMIDYILNHPETDKLIIQSHADENGGENYNYKLTDRRAIAVRNFVVENGLPDEIVEIISRGEMDPVDENWTRQGKARNRRVELYVIQRSAQL